MFYLDDNVMNDILSLINKNIYQVENMSEGYLAKMAPISRSGMYGNGVETVNSQINAIKDGYVNFKNATVSNFNNIVEIENNLTTMASEIYIPSDFEVVDSSNIVSVSNSILYKEDGRSVNEGIDSIEEKEYDSSSIIENQKLFKLKNIDLNVDSLDEYEKTRHDEINSIKNDNEIEVNSLEDYKETMKNNLENVNNYSNLNVTDLGDYVYTNKEELDSMESNEDKVE